MPIPFFLTIFGFLAVQFAGALAEGVGQGSIEILAAVGPGIEILAAVFFFFFFPCLDYWLVLFSCLGPLLSHPLFEMSFDLSFHSYKNLVELDSVVSLQVIGFCHYHEVDQYQFFGLYSVLWRCRKISRLSSCVMWTRVWSMWTRVW